MWRILLLLTVLGGLSVGTLQWRFAGGAKWQQIAPGIEMRELSASESGLSVRVVAFRALPSRLHIATGGAAGGERSARQWRLRERAILAVNGGFFDVAGRSLGVRISDGRLITPRHGTKWPVFVVRRGRASVVAASEFKASRADEAVQCGPRLARNGKSGTFKPQWARRTGLGIQRDGRVIIAVADGPLSLKHWADLWTSAATTSITISTPLIPASIFFKNRS